MAEKKRFTLYSLPIEHAAIEQTIESDLVENFGEVTPEIETLQANLRTMLSAGQDKLEAAAMVCRNLEAEAVSCKDEVKRLAARAKSAENRMAFLKAAMLHVVDSVFDGKIKGSRFTIYGQSAAQTYDVQFAPDVDPFELRLLYPDLIRCEITPSTSEVTEKFKEALKIATFKLLTVDNIKEPTREQIEAEMLAAGTMPVEFTVQPKPRTRFLQVK